VLVAASPNFDPLPDTSFMFSASSEYRVDAGEEPVAGADGQDGEALGLRFSIVILKNEVVKAVRNISVVLRPPLVVKPRRFDRRNR
jgi:hypothetical protein